MGATLSPFFFPIAGNPISSGMTSGSLRVTLPNNLTCAILLIASGITNAAPRLETLETLHLKNNGVRQITSANSEWLLLVQHAVAEPMAHGAGRSSNAQAIAELRLLTGFTWDQVARLFSVSRRSAHLWASGEAMSSDNEEHLHRLLGIVRRASGGDAGQNRAALLSLDRELSLSAFDMLIRRDYEGATRVLGRSQENSLAQGWQWVPSFATLEERAPLPLDVLMAARQDDRPLSPRPARAVKYRRSARDT